MAEMNTAWIGFIVVAVASFSALEAYGWFYYGVPGTLSAHVRQWTSIHPLLLFVTGAAVWGLADHFWGK